jgi:hypothetical protein
MHRGKILHEATKVHPSSIKEIVEATGYKYGTFFKHIKTKDLSYSIIAKYGKVMHKDFSVEFPEMANMPFVMPPNNNGRELSVEQLQSTLQDLQTKYSNILEKHTSAMEELFQLREENRNLRERIVK